MSLVKLIQRKKSFEFVHHCHAIAAIKLSLKFKTPVIVLIRHPRDAIASNYLKHFALKNTSPPDEIDTVLLSHEVLSYVDFYQYVYEMRDAIQIVKFDWLVKNPLEFVNLAKELIDVTDINFCDNDILIFEREFQKKEGGKNPLGSSLPHASRERASEHVKLSLDEHSGMAHCERLFRQIVG